MLRVLGYLFGFGFVVFLGCVAAFAYLVFETSKTLPEHSQLAKYEPAVMSRVHAANGQLLAEYASQRRLFVPVDAIPDQVVQAFISAEDKNFFKHAGIDWSGITRAAIAMAKSFMQGKRRLQGASTITQQVAKNFLLTPERNLDRKLKEALLAKRIEKAFTKDKILELYLNEIYLGLKSYGVAAASLSYFNKSLHELSLEEAAYLAALPKAPNRYHPVKNKERALTRRNWVIDRMLVNGYISEVQAMEAKATSIDVDLRPFGDAVIEIEQAEVFAEEVRRRVIEQYDEKVLYEGGLSIRTTLDPKMQVWARQALTRGLMKFDREKGWRGSVAKIAVDDKWADALASMEMPSDLSPWRLAVVLEVTDTGAAIGLRPESAKKRQEQDGPETGEIPLDLMKWARRAVSDTQLGPKVKAPGDVVEVGDVVHVAPNPAGPGTWHLVQIPEIEGALVALDPHSGRVHALVGGFSYGKSVFNRAVQAKRQPGSAFKPFVYAAALDNGYTPATLVMDEEIEIRIPGQGVWRPKNYGGKFYGPSTLRMGLEKSRNVMTVRLAYDMGIEKVVDYSKMFNIYSRPQSVLSMSLGAEETSLLQLTAAFGMLVNGGKLIEPSVIDRIQDRFGETVYRHDPRTCEDCTAAAWENQPEPDLPDARAQIIDPMTAYQVVYMLEGVVQSGTGSKVKAVGKPLAGKTGTTNDERDAWFVGFSPDLAVGVFVGYDKPRPMGRGYTGGQLAAPIFRDFMQLALQDKTAIPFRVPTGIQFVRINKQTGQRAQPEDEQVIWEAFKPGEAPNDESTVIDIDGNIIEPSYNTSEGTDDLTTGTGGLY
jgi:penicillin-binding protein 1A